MVYELVKCSSPGYAIQSEHIDVIYNQLEVGVCATCMSDELSSNFSTLSVEDKVWELINTPCGAEYIFNAFDDYTYWEESNGVYRKGGE